MDHLSRVTGRRVKTASSPGATQHVTPPSSPRPNCNETRVDLHDLLIEQRLAVERALALNQALVNQLDSCSKHEGIYHEFPRELPREPIPAIPESWPIGLWQSIGTLPPNATLTEPLLSGGSSRSDMPTDKADGPKSPGAGDTIITQHRQSLPSAKEARKLVETLLVHKEYRVEDLYHDTGFAQCVAQSGSFSFMTFVMIVLNTVWIGVDTDLNKAQILCEAPIQYQVVNNAFCFFFSFEILIRFASFRHKRDAFRDTWFVFDLVLVMLIVWETWIEVLIFLFSSHEHDVASMHSPAIFRVFRLVRLTRMARMARVLHSLPEFMILIKGMVLAVRSVSATLSLVLLIIYIYSVLFVQMLSKEDTVKDLFGTIPLAMRTLFQQIVCGFDSDIFDKLLAIGFVYYVLYSLFFLLGYMTMTNMLIGVLCEVVSVEAQTQKEERYAMEVHEQMVAIMGQIDMNGDNIVSKAEFTDLMNHPRTIRSLADLGVDVVALIDFVILTFNECEELPTDDLLQIFAQFRGSRGVTVKDIVDMRKFVSKEMDHLESRLCVSRHFADLEARLPELLTPRLVGS